MADWMFGIGNVAERMGGDPTAGTGSEATLYPFSKWRDGHADEPGGWDHETAGVYSATFDLSMLATSTDKSDAPTGWADLLNLLSGTPGLPASPPDRGTYESRSNVMRVFYPSYQDVLVMPGETVEIDCALFLPAGSTATGVRLLVQDLATGLFWNTGTGTWTGTGTVGSQASAAWLDVTETITPNANRLVPSFYRVIIEPVAGSYGPSTDVYCHDPAIYPQVDTLALVGHNIHLGATINFASGGTPDWTLATIDAPTARHTNLTPALERLWTLTITMPSTNAAFARPPRIGEVWIGKLRDFVSCPLLEVQITHDDPSQVRLVGGRGRVAAWADGVSSQRTVRLRMKARADGYAQMRDELYLGTRRGVDPTLLVAEGYEPGLTVFGRVDSGVQFKKIGPTRQEFDEVIVEEPLWVGERGVNTQAAVP